MHNLKNRKKSTMDGLNIPPSPSFLPHYKSTPDNGILYVAGLNKTVAYVSPPIKDQPRPLAVQIFTLPFTDILLIDCNPNWTNDRKDFAILEKNFHISIWNLYDHKNVSSHKGHENSNPNSKSACAMCYTNDHKVLSIVDDLCIKYCIKSHKYFKYPLKPKWTICIMKISPYNDNIVAAGTKHGLIILMDTNDFSLLYTLRGHDTEIISLDWIKFNANVATTIKSKMIEEKICISSTSMYFNHVWLWDTKTRIGIKKIEIGTNFKIPYRVDVEPITVGNFICWLNNSMLAVLSSEGTVTICNVSWMGENRFEITKDKIEFGKKLEFCIVKKRSKFYDDDQRPTIWVFTQAQTYRKNRQLIFADINSNTINIQAILVIVVGGNGTKFHIIDIKDITPTNFQFKTHIKCFNSEILSLAWHPNNTNFFAYSTKSKGVIMCSLFKPEKIEQTVLPYFTDHPVDQISWGYIDKVRPDNQKRCVLFASCNEKLVYYTRDTKTKTWKNFVTVKDTVNVSAVSAGKHFIAIGFSFGKVALYSLQLKKLWSKDISNSRITYCAWSSIAPNRLAVSSTLSKIQLFTTCDNNNSDKDIAYADGELFGHGSTVNTVKWSQHNKNLLVSSSDDYSVCVWDTDQFVCISRVTYSSRMLFAIFSPHDANLIIATGFNETVHVFDIEKHLWLENKINKQNGNDSKKTSENDVNDSIDNGKGEEQQSLADDRKIASTSAGSVSLASIKSSPSILHLTNKAFNENALQCLQSLMDPKTDEKLMIHTYLFSKRDDVKKLLEIELENHKDTNILSFPQVLMLQMCGNLKMEILKCVESKTLTNQHISLASSISVEFWKNCCKAYAFQCIEKNMTLLAIPYLLGCHEINESINLLCDAHFYREAWILAKFYKDDEDDIEYFNIISNKWINYLELQGNLEGAALVAASVEDYETAIRILSKKSNPGQKTGTILEWMKNMI